VRKVFLNIVRLGEKKNHAISSIFPHVSWFSCRIGQFVVSQFQFTLIDWHLPLFWHSFSSSSLLSRQSGSPSHTKLEWMHSPLLHLNCRSEHLRTERREKWKHLHK
jgi:hypothetical protein